MPTVAAQFVQDWGSCKLVALEGEMGAGKTTFVKAVCAVLGVQDLVSSPTFSIVNEYTTAAGKPFFHFDFYRIDSEEEALDFGVEEYWDSGAFCFMEWTQKVATLLPPNVLKVKIEEKANGKRQLSIQNCESLEEY